MGAGAFISCDFPGAFWGGLGLVALVVGIVVYRRVNAGWGVKGLGTVGMICLCVAAGGPVWRGTEEGEVVVMVDLSPSTRGARYRDGAWLRSRIEGLIPGMEHRVVFFGQNVVEGVEMEGVLADLPSTQTVFTPPPASAVILFSDGRFELPVVAPPTFVAVDPMLEDVEDAAVESVELRGKRAIAKIVNSTDEPLEVLVSPAQKVEAVPIGRIVMPLTPPPPGGELVVRVNSEDRWTENDALGLRIPPAATAERWWVGASARASGWKRMTPGTLPRNAAAYLAPSVIVLENVSAADLSDDVLIRLEQYVRDLSGGLVIVGGNRAFAAGDYPGTALERLSPLASNPPGPTTHWILLADASGSMAAAGEAPWQRARRAMVNLLPHLPPEDVVSIGSFAAELHWWSAGKSAAETRETALPDVTPNGPTNLEPVLMSLIEGADGSMPTEVLLLTDTDAEIRQVETISAGLAAKKIRLNVLALGEGVGLDALRALARGSGGQMLSEPDAEQWPAAARKLLSAAMPDRMVSEAVSMAFVAILSMLEDRTVSNWNRTWLKEGATVVARAEHQGAEVPMGARWAFGAGGVIAAGFGANTAEVEAMAGGVEQRPVDPRFSVSWETGASARVVVEAREGDVYLNEQPLTLELRAMEGALLSTRAIPQVGPGRYELEIERSEESRMATVRLEDRIVGRTAIAGRYPEEFDAVGNDLGRMKALAERSGGRVIGPTEAAIQLPLSQRERPLASVMALLGGMLLAGAVVAWRRG